MGLIFICLSLGLSVYLQYLSLPTHPSLIKLIPRQTTAAWCAEVCTEPLRPISGKIRNGLWLLVSHMISIAYIYIYIYLSCNVGYLYDVDFFPKQLFTTRSTTVSSKGLLLDNLLGSREVAAVLTAGLLLCLNDSDGVGHLTEAGIDAT